jgi:hypothetical protein
VEKAFSSREMQHRSEHIARLYSKASTRSWDDYIYKNIRAVVKEDGELTDRLTLDLAGRDQDELTRKLRKLEETALRLGGVAGLGDFFFRNGRPYTRSRRLVWGARLTVADSLSDAGGVALHSVGRQWNLILDTDGLEDLRCYDRTRALRHSNGTTTGKIVDRARR